MIVRGLSSPVTLKNLPHRFIFAKSQIRGLLPISYRLSRCSQSSRNRSEVYNCYVCLLSQPLEADQPFPDNPPPPRSQTLLCCRMVGQGQDPASLVGQGQEYELVPVSTKFSAGFCPAAAKRGVTTQRVGLTSYTTTVLSLRRKYRVAHKNAPNFLPQKRHVQ